MKLWIEDISGYPAIYYQESDPTGVESSYFDKTDDILSWDAHGLRVLQYMHVRRKIQALVVAVVGSNYSSWSSLSSEEKKVACYWCVAPYSLRLTQYTDEEDYNNWSRLLEKTQGWQFPDQVEGRSWVIQAMRRESGELLRKETWTYNESNAFLEDVLDYMMRFIFGNDQALIQWINGTGLFLLTGFQTKSYYNSDLKDSLNEIYNGYY